MARLVLLNKPYDVLCQFTDEQGRRTLKDLCPLPNVYPAGRLDRDSEGLVLLTDDGRLQAMIADPRFRKLKVYLVQVEGEVTDEALEALRQGPRLKDGPTRETRAQRVVEPQWLWPRDPPVRFRKTVPTSWIELTLTEGRNRQVRRMTAAVGFPTLRLLRLRVGDWSIEGLAPGDWRVLQVNSPPPPLQRAGAGRRPRRPPGAFRRGGR